MEENAEEKKVVLITLVGKDPHQSTEKETAETTAKEKVLETVRNE